jgi:hypothetical protein
MKDRVGNGSPCRLHIPGVSWNRPAGLGEEHDPMSAAASGLAVLVTALAGVAAVLSSQVSERLDWHACLLLSADPDAAGLSTLFTERAEPDLHTGTTARPSRLHGRQV